MTKNIKTLCTDWYSHLTKLDGAYAPSTIDAYYADGKAFVDWCASHSIKPWPASEEVIVDFVTFEGARCLPATVRRRLASIGKIHRLMKFKDPTKSEEVRLAYRRVLRAWGRPASQAEGLTWDDLTRIIETEPDTLTGARNRAMLALGYEMLSRRSEVVALRDNDIEGRPNGTLKVTVRRGKSDPFGEGRRVYTSPETASLVRNWIDQRGRDFPYLFCPIYKGHPLKRELNGKTLERAVKAAASRIGGNDPGFRGHSLRVGAAQELLTRGYDVAAIMRAGGWKSVNTLARYLEKAEHNVWSDGRAPIKPPDYALPHDMRVSKKAERN